MPELAYLNGDILPIDQAKVSVQDRGFQFGDGVYEVVRTYAGRLWAMERHLHRFQRSMEAIALESLVIDTVREAVEKTNARAGFSDALVYWQATRGAAPRAHTFPRESQPTFLVTITAFEGLPSSMYEEGVAVITLPECRWKRRDIKSTNLLPNVLARQQAHESGAFEAVFVEDGHITEGSATNVFLVRDGKVWTTPTGTHILHGITRELVLEIATQCDIPVSEDFFSLDALRSADEVFLTGTSIGVLPVTILDGQCVAKGRVGSITCRLREMYEQRARQGDDAPRVIPHS